MEQVKLGKDSYCFCLLSAGFCVWYCALVLCGGDGGGSTGGTANGSLEAFVLLLKSSGFSPFWHSNNAALVMFGCLCWTADCHPQRENEVRCGVGKLGRLSRGDYDC